MVLDHEMCGVPGCTVHRGIAKPAFKLSRDQQIQEDWVSGEWTVEELGSFWGLDFRTIEKVVRKVDHERELARSV